MTQAERAVLATSQARELCLSLRRAFVGPRALGALRAGQAPVLSAEELRIGLGLVWAAGETGMLREAVSGLPVDRIEADPVVLAFRDLAQRDVTGSQGLADDASP